MNDEIFGRMWTAHHDRFSADVSRALNGASVKAQRVSAAVPMPLKAMAAVLAMSVTSLIFASQGIA